MFSFIAKNVKRINKVRNICQIVMELSETKSKPKTARNIDMSLFIFS